jgi:hypothetical protein
MKLMFQRVKEKGAYRKVWKDPMLGRHTRIRFLTNPILLLTLVLATLYHSKKNPISWEQEVPK